MSEMTTLFSARGGCGPTREQGLPARKAAGKRWQAAALSLASALAAVLGFVVHAEAALEPNLWYMRFFPAMERMERTVDVDGVSRSYIAYVPEEATEDDTLSVIFAFHPARGTADRFRQLTRFHMRDGIQDFIVVYPDGLYGGWNAGDCCGRARLENVNDAGFVEAIFEDLESVATISVDRNFATGFSNGGIMAHEVACRFSGRIVAIATVGATRDMPNGCDPSDPVSVLMIHGLEDEESPYEGGYSFQIFERYGIYRPSVASNIDFWRFENELDTNSQTVTRLIDISCKRYARNTVEVNECPVPDMGHAWPGEEFGDWYTNLYGPQRPDLPGSIEILEFFRTKL